MCRFHKLKFFRILKVVAVQMVIRGAVQFIRAGSQCRHTLFNPFWTMTQLYNRCKFTSIHTHDGGPHYKDKLLERFVMSLCLALVQAATQPLKLMTFDLLSFSQWQVEPRYLYILPACCKSLHEIFVWLIIEMFQHVLQMNGLLEIQIF